MKTMVMWRVVAIVVYAVIASIVSVMAAKYLKEDGSSDGHASSVRAMVTRPSGTSLDDIGGLTQVKEDLRRVVLLPLQYPSIFYGGPKAIRPPSGILLHGPPGTGKTMLARALASESNVPFLALHSAALESKWWGETPKILQAAFELARKELAPCLLFFDEIDGLGRARNESDQSCVYSFKCELLRNLDGVADTSSAPVMVLACTNCPEALDPALRRRFQRVFKVDKPTRDERFDILWVLVRDEAVVDEEVLGRVATAADGMTGADLAALFADASSARLDADLARTLQTVATGADLLAQLGPLAWEHWRHAASSRGRTWGKKHTHLRRGSNPQPWDDFPK